MKKIRFAAVACLAGMVILSSCHTTANKGDRMPEVTSAQIDTVSYALGMWAANIIKSSDMGELNYSEYTKGFFALLEGRETKLSEDDIMDILQQYAMKRGAYAVEKAKTEGENFLAENKTEEGVVETESGLQYRIDVEGEGVNPGPKDTVTVHYEGKLLNGDKFDSSYDRGEPAEFSLTGVIKGWSEGLQYMKEGGKATFYIPSALAYGERGTRGIPGNSLLIFEVELIKVKPFVEVAEPAAK